MRYNDLITFLEKSSFAWHSELACRQWLTRGDPNRILNTPRVTEWMAVLGLLNPILEENEQYGISPTAEPPVPILQGYYYLIKTNDVQETAARLQASPMPETLADFLIQW